MASVSVSAPPEVKSLSDPALKDQLQQLRQTDNLTNWYYLVRTYLYLVLVIGGAVWFFEWQAGEGFSFWWNVPVALVSIVLVGGGPDRFSVLGPEASHDLPLRKRRLQRP